MIFYTVKHRATGATLEQGEIGRPADRLSADHGVLANSRRKTLSHLMDLGYRQADIECVNCDADFGYHFAVAVVNRRAVKKEYA